MLANQVTSAFHQWYAGLTLYAGLPARGTIAGALVVLQRLRESCDLDIDAHSAAGGVQIQGTSGRAVSKLLTRYGETRPFLAEGGRTNMGLRGDIKALLNQLSKTELAKLPLDERGIVLDELQQFLVAKVQEYPPRPGLKVKYVPTASGAASVHGWLDVARRHGKEGPVAHHLIGALLQLRFPELAIRMESVSAADQQLGRAGDFRVGDTVFHVTAAPMQSVYEKCKRNLRTGLRVYLLVTQEHLITAGQMAEMNVLGDRIDVASIESFVADNIGELSNFSADQLAHGFLRLLKEYNRHVDLAELDKSLMIEIPANLQRLRPVAPGA